MPVSSIVFGQEHEPKHPEPPDEVFHDIQVRERQLDIEERESGLEFENAMRKLKMEERKLELDKKRQALERRERRQPTHREAGRGLFLAVCVIVNLLLAIWVYQDIRKRNAGSGIWIVVTLLAGVFGAIVYAIIRIGDKE